MNPMTTTTNPPPRICVLTSVHPPLDIRIFYRQARSTREAGFDHHFSKPADIRVLGELLDEIRRSL